VSLDQLREMQQMLRNPGESEQVQAFAAIIAGLEHQQLQAVEDLHDALGIDGIERTADVEARQQQLLELADAMANSDLTRWWFEDGPASTHLDHPEDAMDYVGLSDEDWQDRIAGWAAAYRDRSEEFEEMSDREIAEQHVRSQFGVPLDVFEREVVAFDRGTALQTIIATNFEAVTEGVQAATAAIDEGDDDA